MKKLILQYAIFVILLVSGLQILRFTLTIKYDFQEYFLFLLGSVFMVIGIFVARFFRSHTESKYYNPGVAITNQFSLTKAEIEVAELLLKGYSNAEIADFRCVSMNTIKTQISSIYTKMEVKNRTSLLAKMTRIQK